MKNKASWIRVAAYVMIGAVGGFGIYAWSSSSQAKPQVVPGTRLNAGGSSVVYFVMDKWKQAYKKDKGIELRFHSSGSHEGVAQVIDGHYMVGFTSSPLSEEQRTQAKNKGGDIIQVPAVIIGIVPVYKLAELEGKPPLKFTADVLAKIYLGQIKKWNDKELVELNPDLKDVDKSIIVTCRKDSSGTTFTFTNFLGGASELWRKEMSAPSTDVVWKGIEPNLLERNSGVAVFVKNTEGAIGYVELINAVALKLKYGAVQNKEKEFVLASPETLKAAAKAAAAEMPGKLPTNLTNRAGKNSYPITAVDWAVCYKLQPAADFKLVSEFMTWMTHAGQDHSKIMDKHEDPPAEIKGKGKSIPSAEERGKARSIAQCYAPLPEEFVQRADEKLKLISSR